MQGESNLIATLIDLLKNMQRKRFYVLVLISLLVAGITLLLAFELSPWLYATNARVELHLEAPSETNISICWEKTQNECLPLVPYISKEQRIANRDEIADTWLSELPPRPAYALSLRFKPNTKAAKGVFHDLEVNSQRILLWGYLPEIGIQDIKLRPDEFHTTDVRYTIRGGLYDLEWNPKSRLTASREIKPGPATLNDTTNALLIWGLLFSAYLLFAIPLYFLPFAIQNRQSPNTDLSLTSYPKWVYIIGGGVIITFLLLAFYSPVMFYLSDQIVYVGVAMRQDWLVYPARPPGYYMFVALLFWLFHNQLEPIVLTQTILLASSTALCVWALRRWLHPLLVIPLICGILFSPSQMSWIHSILREGIFVSLVLLGVTSVIAHFTTPNKLPARAWLAAFSVICGLTIFVRENGIILPGILLPALLPEALKYLKSSEPIWKRLKTICFLGIRYIAPVACTAVVYLGLSSYNYLNYGYFQFTLHVTSHHFLWQELAPANFDPRGLLEASNSIDEEAKSYLGQRIYRSFIEATEETPYLDPIYVSLFPTVNQMTAQNGDQSANLFHSAKILDQIGKNAYSWVPWKADLIGMIRQYKEFLLSKASGNYKLFPDDPAGLSQKQQLLASVTKDVTYQGKPTASDSIIAKYYDSTSGYEWYRPLFFLALLVSIYILRYHDPVFLIPITLFMGNGLLMVMLRGEYARFVECLDVLLVLQVALGLSCWIQRRQTFAGKMSS